VRLCSWHCCGNGSLPIGHPRPTSNPPASQPSNDDYDGQNMTQTQRTYVNCILHVLWLVLFASPDPTTAAVSPQCYFNDGSLAAAYQPCNSSSSTHSACCNLGSPPGNSADFCLSTGLCFWQKASASTGLIYANGCTDQTGRDPNCQQICTGGVCPVLGFFLRLCMR
jgi:hypothetical protein